MTSLVKNSGIAAMRISSKLLYALRALFDITFHNFGKPTKVDEIATREEVPPRFLEQIFQDLKMYHTHKRLFTVIEIVNLVKKIFKTVTFYKDTLIPSSESIIRTQHNEICVSRNVLILIYKGK